MDTEKNTTPSTDENNEATSFKAKREQWEAEWKAEFKRDWEQNWNKSSQSRSDWENSWKKHNWKRNDRGHTAAIKLELNGQNYSISIGKIILAVILFSILPFKFLLVGGAIWAAYHFGRRSIENDSNGAGKSKHNDVTAA